MIIDVQLIDTTPEATPGPCSPAFIPPATVTTRKQYAAWLLAQYETSELVAQHVYMAHRWNQHEWSRPLKVSGPFADAFPRILNWVMEQGEVRRAVRKAERAAQFAARPRDESLYESSDELGYFATDEAA